VGVEVGVKVSVEVAVSVTVAVIGAVAVGELAPTCFGWLDDNALAGVNSKTKAKAKRGIENPNDLKYL
jgi:hypothetical protein